MKLALAFLAGVVTATWLFFIALVREDLAADKRREARVPAHDPDDPGPGKLSRW